METEQSLRKEFLNNNRIKGLRCICCEWKTRIIPNAYKYLNWKTCPECKFALGVKE